MTIYVQGIQDGNLTLKDGVNPDKADTVKIADSVKTVETGWAIKSAGEITFESQVGWDLLIDTIFYQGPA